MYVERARARAAGTDLQCRMSGVGASVVVDAILKTDKDRDRLFL